MIVLFTLLAVVLFFSQRTTVAAQNTDDFTPLPAATLCSFINSLDLVFEPENNAVVQGCGPSSSGASVLQFVSADSVSLNLLIPRNGRGDCPELEGPCYILAGPNGSAGVGETSEIWRFEHNLGGRLGFLLAFKRGRFAVVVGDMVRNGGGMTQGQALSAAEEIDARIVEFLESEGTPALDNTGSEPDSGGTGERPTSSNDGVDAEPTTGDEGLDGEGLADDESISDEEAIVASIAGVAIALLMSGLTLAEVGLRLTDLFGNAGADFAESLGDMPPPTGLPSDSGPMSVSSENADGSSRHLEWGSNGSSTETITASDGSTRVIIRDRHGNEVLPPSAPAPLTAPSQPGEENSPWYESPNPPSGGAASTQPQTPTPGPSEQPLLAEPLGDAPLSSGAPRLEGESPGSSPAGPVSGSASPSSAPAVPGFGDDVMDLLDDAPLGGQVPPLVGQWVDGTPTRLTDNDGDGVYDRVRTDSDRDGTFDEARSRPLVPDPATEAGVPPDVSDPPNSSDEDGFDGTNVAVDTDDISGQPDSTDPAGVPAPDPSGLTEVTQREIDDIYERGLRGGRSLDDLREDVAGLNDSRGGSGEVGNPYGLEMVSTDAGPVPLTPQEVAGYRAARNELGELRRQRDELMQEWQHQDARFQQWRQRNPIQNAEDVWNNETGWQRDIAEQNEWISVWNDWLGGETLRRAPDGSTYNEQFGHLNDPEWHSGDNESFAHERIRHHRHLRDRYESARVRDIERAANRPSAADELAAIDKAKEDIFERRRAVASQQEKANESLTRFHSYANGRPLPGA